MDTEGSSLMSQGDEGQYMVEFALTFAVFMFFVFMVIDMGLMIYNHNLFYNAVYRGAREAALGGSNDEVRNTVENIAAENYFPSLLMVARPKQGVQIQPSNEIDRVQGRTVRVSMRTTFGLNVLGLIPITVTFPISSEELVHTRNDSDRDGLKDALEANPRDHNNNGVTDAYLFGGSDDDADDDGADAGSDTVTVGYFDSVTVSCPTSGSCAGPNFSGYAIERPNDDADESCDVFVWPATSDRVWQTAPCFDGDYHAPEIWDSEKDAPEQVFPRELPTWHVDNSASISQHTRTLRTEHDSDNDGWIDKFDEADNDATTH